jgi:hypothetical protein
MVMQVLTPSGQIESGVHTRRQKFSQQVIPAWQSGEAVQCSPSFALPAMLHEVLSVCQD